MLSLLYLGLGPDRSVFFKSCNWQEAKTCPPCYVLFFPLRLSSLGRKVLFDPSSYILRSLSSRKYSDISSESPWNRNTRLCSTLRASRCEESEFLTFIFHVGDRSRHLGTLFRFCWVGTLPMAWALSSSRSVATSNQRKSEEKRRESWQ